MPSRLSSAERADTSETAIVDRRTRRQQCGHISRLDHADHWFVGCPGNGQATFSTCDANSFDTSMVLYDGADCSTTVQVARNGDAPAGDGQQYHRDHYEVTSGCTTTSVSVDGRAPQGPEHSPSMASSA